MSHLPYENWPVSQPFPSCANKPKAPTTYQNRSKELLKHLGLIEKFTASAVNGTDKKIREAITKVAQIISCEQEIPMREAFEAARQMHQQDIRDYREDQTLTAENCSDMLDGLFTQAAERYAKKDPHLLDQIFEGKVIPMNEEPSPDIPRSKYG